MTPCALFRSAGVRRRTTAAVTAVCAAIALPACNDGYPTHDVVAPHGVAGPTSDGLLASLNAMSLDVPGTHRWRYALAGPCRLSAAPGNDAPRDTALSVPLSGHWVSVRADDATDGFTVTMDPLGDEAAAPLPVFRADRWRDASAAAGLVQRLIAACRATAG